jgi:serine/threonine protein kinase
MPDRIGRYRVTGLLGTGASSTVLSAHDPDLDVDVAIKLLADHLAAREEVVQQFLGEARVLRDLADPHVVGVHDVGVLDSGQPYLVMDLLDDGTLADRLRVLAEAGVSPVPADGLAVGLALADSVAALEQLGLVHGDIKPENIFLRRDPSAVPAGTGGAVPSGVLGPGVGLVLGDFGLVGEQGEAASGAGSAGYAAPEQERGAAVDVRSDLYSAAAVVHRVVRGMPPKGPIMEPVPVSGPQRTGLDRFFGEALAFDPSARPPSPEIWRDRLRADVVAELSGTFAASTAERRRSGGSSRRGAAVAVLCLILGVLVVASVVVAATKGSGGGVPELVAVGGGPSAGEAVGLSPDGRVSSLASAQRADEVTTATSGAVSGVQP